jgi:hypothetical protein
MLYPTWGNNAGYIQQVAFWDVLSVFWGKGHQADYVAIEWEVTELADLGFTVDNERANMGSDGSDLTCARKSFISVANSAIWETSY